MHRFFVPREWIGEDRVELRGESAHQISHVLKLKPPEHIILLDNRGWEYEVQLEGLSGELVQGRVVGKSRGTGEPGVKITLCQALLKSDKFELVLQKGVELGVSAFVPFISQRCVVRKPNENRLSRWRKIIQEAAEQSGRVLLPQIHPVVSFEEACQLASSPALLLWEEEKSLGLANLLRQPSFQKAPAYHLFVGPEGGFPAHEVEYARARGIISASLGRRVLRAETAGLAAISALLFARGELG
ncbi:MAG: RsmE family RNA methyltransferase [Chloroflexota bacterium]